MKQKKLIEEVYRACLDHDSKKLQELCQEEYKKIFKRRAQGKSFTPKWTLIRM